MGLTERIALLASSWEAAYNAAMGGLRRLVPTAVWGLSACLVGAVVVGCGGDGTTGGFEQLGGGGGGGGSSAAGGTGPSAHVSSSAQSGGGAAALGPPYPIVLAHGFFGFDDFAGAGFVDYFHGVKAHLATRGEPLVFTPEVDPFNDSTTRGAQLAEKIESILAETGHEKVNIVGHSQGGLDARVVASLYPERVASVITLQTPHHGTPVADIVLKLVADPALQDLLDLLVQLAGQALYDEVGAETSLAAALRELSEEGAATFNATYLDRPGIYYASIAGRSDHHDGGSDCAVNDAPKLIASWGGERDPIEPLLSVSEAILDGGLGDPYPNDGLVRVRDARWGRFLGCLPADHMDQIGQLFGDSPGLGNAWSHLEFFDELVQHLRAQGL